MIAREQYIEQSVQERIKDLLYHHFGYTAQQVALLDAFDAAKFDGPLDKNLVTAGFDFDDGGTSAEMGSALIRRVHTIELWIVGLTPTWGKNLSAKVKDAVEADLRIPLLDIANPAKPIIDWLIVDEVQREKPPIENPRPWQQSLYIVRLRVTDEYMAALT